MAVCGRGVRSGYDVNEACVVIECEVAHDPVEGDGAVGDHCLKRGEEWE